MKKLVALLLTLALCAGLVTLPAMADDTFKIVMMVDTTVVDQNNGRDAFEARWEERRREFRLATNARSVSPLPDDPFLKKRPQLLYQIFFCGARGCLEPPCCSSQLKTVTHDYPSR